MIANGIEPLVESVPQKRKVIDKLVVAYFILLTTLLVAFYWPELNRHADYYMSDHVFYFQPFVSYIGERLRRGEWPLWNPYLYCGMSQIAVPSPGVFFPGTWLFAVCNYSQGVALNMIGHQLIAALGAFLLVISFGWGALPAMACATAFAFSGYMFTLLTNFTLSLAGAWIPLVLWSFRALLLLEQSEPSRDRGPKIYATTVVAALSLFMLVAAGRPEVTIPGAALLACWLLIHLKDSFKFNALRWQVLAIIIAALLSSLIILPTVEWVKLSPRANGLNLSQVLMWSSNWYDFLCVIFLEPFGDLQRLGNQFLPLVTTRQLYLPYIPSCYVGPVVLTLCLFGLCDRNWKSRWLAVGLIAVVVTMCVGEHWPIAPYLVTHIKALSVFRYPIKWMVFLVLALAICAARGLYCVQRKEIGPVAIGVSVAVWGLFAALQMTFLGLGSRGTPWHVGPTNMPPAAELALATAMLFGCVIGFASVALYHYGREKLNGSNLALIYSVSIIINLIIGAFLTMQITEPGDFYGRQPATLETLNAERKNWEPGQRVMSICFDPFKLPRSLPTKGPVFTPSYYSYARDILNANTAVAERVPVSFGYEAAETSFFRQLGFMSIHRSPIALQLRKDGKSKDVTGDLSFYRFCQATATRGVLAQLIDRKNKPIKLDDRYFKSVSKNPLLNYQLLEVREPLPRAYFSPYWRWIDTQHAVFDSIYNDPAHFDPHLVTAVNKHDTSGGVDPDHYDPTAPKLPAPPSVPPLAPAIASSAASTDAPNFISAAKILVDQPEHVSVSVNVKSPGWVVLADHWYPGWHALVDGVAQPIYKANAESRAVYIPAGAHLIEFNFQPESLKIATLLATVAGAIIAILIVLAIAPYAWIGIKRSAGQ